MKKVRIIVFSLIAIALIAILAFFIIRGVKAEGRKYSVEKVENYNYFVLKENNKYGVIDKEAKVLIEPKFEEVVIPNPSKGIFICTTENNETKIYNENQEEKFNEYNEVSAIRLKGITSDLMYEKSVLKYCKDGKYGLIDYAGKKITDANYGNIEGLEYKEGELLVEQDGKYGVINIRGNSMIPIKYQTIKVDGFYSEEDEYKNDGYIVGVKTEDGYRYGYIDFNGDEILKTEYNQISRVTEIYQGNDIYFIASKNGQFGVYKNSEQLINNEYQSISYEKDNKLFLLEKSKRYGMANIAGNIVLKVKYSQVDVNGKYLYAKEKDGTETVFDINGNTTNIDANTLKYDVADGKYTIVVTTKENKSLYSVQDEKENEIIKPEYIYIVYLFDNYFIAGNENGKLGIIDETGTEKIPFNYETIRQIENTKMIQAVSGDVTEIYSNTVEKICQMSNAKVEIVGEYIRIYNDNEEKYINEDAQIVDHAEVKQKTSPEIIGDYKKVIYGTGEVYYTK